MSVADFESVLDVHVVGAFALTRATVPHMKQHGNACVLFTASMTSFLGQPYVTGYAAAKSAYLGLIHGMATELSGAGIRVNGVALAGLIRLCCAKPLKATMSVKTKSLAARR